MAETPIPGTGGEPTCVWFGYAARFHKLASIRARCMSPGGWGEYPATPPEQPVVTQPDPAQEGPGL